MLIASGRKLVKEEDLAVFLMLLRFFTKNMNADGSLPTARWRAMWMALHGAGDIDRGWCHHRFARMRNFLGDKDLLSWQDEDFVAGVFDDGRFVPGMAAKWKASEELMAMIEQAGRQDVVGDQNLGTGKGGDGLLGYSETVHGEDEGKEGGESILSGYSDQGQGSAGEREGRRSTLYGYTGFEMPTLAPKSRQSTSFLEELAILGIEMHRQRPRFVGYSTGSFRMAA